MHNGNDNCFEPTGTTAKTRAHIKQALRDRLKSEYGSTKVKDFLKLQGFDDARFDYISSVANMMYADLSSDGIDNNANKTIKSFSRVQSEVDNAHHKLHGHDALYRQLKQNVGKEEATRLSAEMYDYTLGINDSTKLLVNYCWALSGIPLVLNGRDGNPRCAPPKHMHSYVSMLAGEVHILSNNFLAGAVAVPTLFLDSARILLLDGYTIDMVKNDAVSRKYIENLFQQFIYDLNDPSRSSAESPFSNVSLFGGYKLKGVLEDLAWYYEDTGYDLDYVHSFVMELQKIYMDFIDKGDPLTGLPYTFPVNTLNLAKDDDNNLMDGEFVEEFCHRKVHAYNILVSKGMRTASCCRLLSDSEMMDVASSVNSFGGGGSLSIGSHRVVCINMPRIALMATSEEDFMKRLDSLVKDAVTILKAHKDLILRLSDIGLQPKVADGTLDMTRMFSTVGILGIWEMFTTLKNKFGEDSERDVRVMKAFNEMCVGYGKEFGLIVNIEQIPGESMAVRFCKADKLLFGEKAVPYYIYSNQTIPLTENVDVYDRMDADGRINLLLTGGGIVHLTIGEKVTPSQAANLINYAAKSGAEHFALNLVHSICSGTEEHICEGKYDKCPICGASVDDYALRIVGFLRRVSSWSDDRKREFQDRHIISNDKIKEK